MKKEQKESCRYSKIEQLAEVSLLEAFFVSFSYAPHAHDTFAVGQTLSGFQDFVCRGKKHRGFPGTLITINPDEVHDGHSGLETGFAYRMLYIPAETLFSLAHEIWGEQRHASPYFLETVHRDTGSFLATSHFFNLLKMPGAEAPHLESSLLETLGALLERHGECRKEFNSVPSGGKIVQDAKEYLRHNPAGKVTLDELAARFGDTPYMFLKRFRKITGMPPHRFQLQCRVDLARQLLLQDLPLVEIAAETGFCDQSHFNRRFREIVGVSPGAYRRAVRTKGRIVYGIGNQGGGGR
jgi:AraC-like DNA-binding protein